MNAKITANQISSNLLSEILSAYNSAEDDHELLSTEEFLFNVEKFNTKIREGLIDGENLTIGSLDVENLYGSVNTKVACNVIREEVMNSPLNFEGIDWRWALVYCALTLTPIEIVDQKLHQLIPRKLAAMKATIKTVKKDETHERWHYLTPLKKWTKPRSNKF